MQRHIAIVEDEAAIRHNYEDALRRYGYHVSGYGDRNSAFAAFSRRLPELVIIDVGLGSESEGGFRRVASVGAIKTGRTFPARAFVCG